ncbi:V-type proton ATPase 21 kDa proteolipid subunit [Elysia marginata]|uniref:V-type proton ATPase 21 kDa proteolipid subunit n=1 Tax=Elysia marginata TaxID=1093978 RepID=A0AAV4E8E2_9GAST|nr:V-type proton ATPase 21 kDa proteolipid subunit [Elysia marginata]
MQASRTPPGVMPVPTEPTKRYGTPLGPIYGIVSSVIIFLLVLVGIYYVLTGKGSRVDIGWFVSNFIPIFVLYII